MEILLVDDDTAISLSLAAALRTAGHEVAIAPNGAQGLSKLRADTFDLVICDVRMPGADGFAILDYARSTRRAQDVVLMTAHGGVDDAVRAIKQHATDYLVKPFEPRDLIACVTRIAERQSINRCATVVDEPDTGYARHGLVGRSAGIVHVREQIDAAGPTDAPVLITGESGTGKELVARALHVASARSAGPFVAINCASFPNSLLEAELFGHSRGAFTGADRERVGRFAASAGGTLFLDEISEMRGTCQAKLLRVLQERVFSPLGTNDNIPLDARLLSATNRPLRDAVQAREFREDLYYRIKVLAIEVPPLREREGDLALLCSHFLRKSAPASGHPAMSHETWALLTEHEFRGNVRELEHAMQHAVVLARAAGAAEILPAHLPTEIWKKRRDEARRRVDSPAVQPLTAAMRGFERTYLLRALAMNDGNKTRTADRLGISRKNLWEKLRRHAISDAEVDREIAAASSRGTQ